jgi:hypothetical protein
MGIRGGIAWVAICLWTTGVVHADLKQAMAEPNLEKRSKLALDQAESTLQEAREAYHNGELDRVKGLVADVGQAVDLALTSLRATNKDPRRSPKWFKRAELETRDLNRKIESFSHEMSYNDRGLLENLHTKVQQVHEDLLMGLMEGKRK